MHVHTHVHTHTHTCRETERMRKSKIQEQKQLFHFNTKYRQKDTIFTLKQSLFESVFVLRQKATYEPTTKRYFIGQLSYSTVNLSPKYSKKCNVFKNLSFLTTSCGMLRNVLCEMFVKTLFIKLPKPPKLVGTDE